MMAKAIMTQQRVIDLAAQQRAEELAAQQRAAAERARKRAALQLQIQQWHAKLANVKFQLSSLEAEQSKLNTYLGDWAMQKNTYSGNEILSDVVIVNIFEGVCADRIKNDFSTCITEMDQTYGRVSGLNRNVSAQIVRLNQQMFTINARVTSLRNELNSI